MRNTGILGASARHIFIQWPLGDDTVYEPDSPLSLRISTKRLQLHLDRRRQRARPFALRRLLAAETLRASVTWARNGLMSGANPDCHRGRSKSCRQFPRRCRCRVVACASRKSPEASARTRSDRNAALRNCRAQWRRPPAAHPVALRPRLRRSTGSRADSPRALAVRSAARPVARPVPRAAIFCSCVGCSAKNSRSIVRAGVVAGRE